MPQHVNSAARATRHIGRVARRGRVALALALALVAGAAGARGGAYKTSRHGDPAKGAFRTPTARRGACGQCHGRAAQPGAGANAFGLFAPNDNGLCFSCHRLESETFSGQRAYEQSSHATSSAFTWPGPNPAARASEDAGKCVNCHDPHGAKDAQGAIPAMLHLRGPGLCLACHDGAPAAKDVASELRQPYRHPLRATRDTGKNAADESCGICHDAHAGGGVPVVGPGGVRRVLEGAPRVRVASAAAGAEPVTVPLRAADPGSGTEYEVCFVCHGTLGPGAAKASVAAQTNPANASFHPIQALGRNARIDPGAFVNGWSDARLVACSDCHSGMDGRVRGPHGSSFQHLLKRRAPTPARQPMLEGDLCFDCHAYRTYADPAATAAHARSRFQEHAAHVSRNVTCAACHAAHGSPKQPALLVVGPLGLSGYEQRLDGAACTTSCHSVTPPSGTYRAPYGR